MADTVLPTDCNGGGAGKGSCPFGSSCFYRHVHHDGRTETVDLRFRAGAEGLVAPMEQVRPRVCAPMRPCVYLPACLRARAFTCPRACVPVRVLARVRLLVRVPVGACARVSVCQWQRCVRAFARAHVYGEGF